MAKKFEMHNNKVLGQGGYGTVYEGTFNGKQVAIKKINLNGREEKMPDREKDALLQLGHPNVLRLYHWEDGDDFRYLVLELCVGTLGDFIKGKYKGTMPSDMDALLQMTAGVQYIHSNNFVHRDIKPDNILISKPTTETEEVHLKVSDFGLCKSTTERGTYSLSGIKGTRIYMAAEVLSIDDLHPGIRGTTKSDVFSLGCVFSEFLSRGKHPFGNDSSVMQRIATGQIQNERCCKDPFLNQFVKKMIQLNPNDRPHIDVVARKLNKQFSIVQKLCYDDEDSGSVYQCSFHPSNLKLACALDRGQVCIFSAPDALTPFSKWERMTLQATTTALVVCIAWNVDGSNLAAGCKDGTLIVWKEDGEKLFETKEHPYRINCIDWNKTDYYDHMFVTAGDSKTAIIWTTRLQSMTQNFQFHGARISDVTWIASDAFATSSDDKTIKICEIGLSTPKRTFHHTDKVNSILWVEENKQLVSCSNDGTIKVWSLEQDEPVASLEGNGDALYSFDLWRSSDDESRLVRRN